MTIEETILNAFELDLRQAWDLAQMESFDLAGHHLDQAREKLQQLKQRQRDVAFPANGAAQPETLPPIDV